MFRRSLGEGGQDGLAGQPDWAKAAKRRRANRTTQWIGFGNLKEKRPP